MNPLDSAPASGASILGVAVLVLTLALELVKRGNRKRQESAKSIPPTAGHEPSPQQDRAILERLDRAEQHDALVGALFRTQAELVDEKRKNEVLREANNKLSLEVYALRHDNERKDTQLRAERMSTRVLREQLAHVEKELAAKNEELELAHADLRRALLVRGQ